MDIAEPTITCPYNKAHSIISSRMQFHLSKCRLQYPTVEKVVCPFNTTHVVGKVELEIHQLLCEDRIVLDSFTCKVGSSAEIKVAVAKIEPLEIRGDECWDDDTIDGSVLERVQEASKAKPTLQALIGAPKSERKAFRNLERRRIQRVLDNQLAENKSGGNEKKKEKPPQVAKKDAESAKGKVEDIDEKNGRGTPKGGSGNQATEPENIFGGVIQKPSADAFKGQKNPWHSSKTFMNMNGTNDNTKQIESDIKPISLLLNDNEHQNKKDVKDSTYATIKSVGNMKIEETLPATAKRDPTNPWGSNKLPPSKLSSYGDQSDFPTLPVASRGRGRDRISFVRSK